MTSSDQPTLDPTEFSQVFSERLLEEAVVANPSLLGEAHMVLGCQRQPRPGERRRLDVLALHRDGTPVVAELKYDGMSGDVDHQARAYAHRIGSWEPERFAEALRETVADTDHRAAVRFHTGLSKQATVDDVSARIAAHLGLRSFKDWRPRQPPRIELVAPGFQP